MNSIQKCATCTAVPDPTDCPVRTTPCPVTSTTANILERLETGIILIDSGEKEILHMNAAAAEMLPLATANGFSALQTLLAPSREPCGGGAGEGPTLPRSVQVGSRILGYSAYHTSDTHCCILIRDITEKSRLESIAEAVTSAESMGYIVSGIRHEIGNPVNSVKMALSVLRAGLDTFSIEAVRTYLDRMLAEISRVEYLLRSLKSFNLYERPVLQDVDFGELITTFLGLVRGDIERRGIQLETDFEHEHEGKHAPRVLVDARALQQALFNVLANAIDALGGRLTPHITFRTSAAEEFVLLSIEDTGCGVAAREHLFKAFRTTKPHGNGLGLVLTRKMLAYMNCTIEVQSAAGIGTVVSITIPRVRATHAEPA